MHGRLHSREVPLAQRLTQQNIPTDALYVSRGRRTSRACCTSAARGAGRVLARSRSHPGVTGMEGAVRGGNLAVFRPNWAHRVKGVHLVRAVASGTSQELGEIPTLNPSECLFIR